MANNNAAVIASMKPNKDSIMVTESNLPTGVIYKNRHILQNVKYWHKFIVTNTENMGRNDVLRAVLDHVHPLDLIPVFYIRDNKGTSSFLARNCGAAVEKLCKDNLIIPCPAQFVKQKKKVFFKLTIILNFSTTNEIRIDVQKNVLSVLNKRFHYATNTLDLSKFCEDEELTEFCPLSQPKIMYFVLHIAKSLQPEEIILSHNAIKLVNPFEVLQGVKLSSIDISNNLIPSLAALDPLKYFDLKRLKLDGNPLCAACDEDTYLAGVKDVCPNIEMLDGVLLRQGGFPIPRKNFFCDPSCADLTNQFIEYFFTVYDSRNRGLLIDLYHRNAMFSLTSDYIPNQLSSSTSQLKIYNMSSRNISRLADVTRINECLSTNRLEILHFFNKLPQTEHDPYSFSVDVVYKSAYCVVIVVSGVFHELATSLLDKERTLGFTRTFALEILNGDQEVVIVNELLHVYNALSGQQQNAFKESKPMKLTFMPKPETLREQMEVVETMQAISNLKDDWAKKCLEECNYDLKVAIELFVDLYKADKIPQEAFIDEYDNKESIGNSSIGVVSRGRASSTKKETSHVNLKDRAFRPNLKMC